MLNTCGLSLRLYVSPPGAHHTQSPRPGKLHPDPDFWYLCSILAYCVCSPKNAGALVSRCRQLKGLNLPRAPAEAIHAATKHHVIHDSTQPRILRIDARSRLICLVRRILASWSQVYFLDSAVPKCLRRLV